MLNRKLANKIGKQNIKNINFKKYEYKYTNFPFWAKIRFDKERPTLVIDEDLAFDKRKKKLVPGFVHREATHSYKKGYEKIEPNPYPKDPNPMYLKKVRKTPKSFFVLEKRKIKIPKYLKEKYSKQHK